MLRPNVFPGMEKAYDFSRILIDACDVWAFKAIAVDTAQGQIVKLCFDAVLAGNDVIDLKRGGRRGRR